MGNSFIFSLRDDGTYTKHICTDKQYEVYFHSNARNYLISMGNYDDLAISNNCNQNTDSYSNLGVSYQLPNGMSKNTD